MCERERERGREKLVVWDRPRVSFGMRRGEERRWALPVGHKIAMLVIIGCQFSAGRFFPTALSLVGCAFHVTHTYTHTHTHTHTFTHSVNDIIS